MAENKVVFGLKHVHYAKVTETAGVVTYGTPVRLPGAVELSLEPRGDMTEFYADDILYYSNSNNNGYDGTLSLANIPESFATEILGEVADETDGVITESANIKSEKFALMFEFDGDQKATRHVLYYCSASRPTVSGATKTETAEPQPNELTFVASPRPSDYLVKTKTGSGVTPAIYDAWYDGVYEKTVV